jgi:hypothetical protein
MSSGHSKKSVSRAGGSISKSSYDGKDHFTGKSGVWGRIEYHFHRFFLRKKIRIDELPADLIPLFRNPSSFPTWARTEINQGETWLLLPESMADLRKWIQEHWGMANAMRNMRPNETGFKDWLDLDDDMKEHGDKAINGELYLMQLESLARR